MGSGWGWDGDVVRVEMGWGRGGFFLLFSFIKLFGLCLGGVGG